MPWPPFLSLFHTLTEATYHHDILSLGVWGFLDEIEASSRKLGIHPKTPENPFFPGENFLFSGKKLTPPDCRLINHLINYNTHPVFFENGPHV